MVEFEKKVKVIWYTTKVIFWMKIFSTRKILLQVFCNVSDFEFKVLLKNQILEELCIEKIPNWSNLPRRNFASCVHFKKTDSDANFSLTTGFEIQILQLVSFRKKKFCLVRFWIKVLTMRRVLEKFFCKWDIQKKIFGFRKKKSYLSPPYTLLSSFSAIIPKAVTS